MVTKSTQYFLYLQDKSNKVTLIGKLAVIGAQKLSKNQKL